MKKTALTILGIFALANVIQFIVISFLAFYSWLWVDDGFWIIKEGDISDTVMKLFILFCFSFFYSVIFFISKDELK